ncbi:Gfo/Idh/MocA family protein [Paenibacillus flagellatus]|uniref:Oxidoreductase n=1 Tax=Paenibacillus flagellatus TaxID=2211139 RepID=A0A2V5KFY2_9BACL|nr:Gfo/Idh/MocA family oxidoreductase [Paenibacillus flagellatus]PYI57474.1 oxidoreductase [Paenibacillus flagellatus]
MAARKDGMHYAPKGKPNPVVSKGEFPFAAVHLDHGHIYGMCNGLKEAGGDIVAVYDPDPDKVSRFRERFPSARAAASLDEVLNDPSIRLIAAAAVPNERGPLGVRAMEAGKDYFTDKAPFTSLEQLEAAKAAVRATGRKYMVYYSERLHVESAVYASELIARGAIGRVVSVAGFGPHKLNAASRPDWFFRRERYGGILCDIGSHQIEQMLHFTGAKDATVVASRVANYSVKTVYPELEDFGDALLRMDNGATGYFRVDWLSPDGLGTWGDGRTIIQGTDGYIELRKYIDIARDPQGDQLYLVNREGEFRFALSGQVGYPFFGELILDCLNRTEIAMTQDHAFKAAELCLLAQRLAVRIE